MNGMVRVIALLLPATAWAVDVQLVQQGRVIAPNGAPVHSSGSVTVSLWRDATSTDAVADRVYTQTSVNQPVAGGYYWVQLGAGGSMNTSLLDGNLFMEVRRPTRAIPLMTRQ